MKRSRFTEQQAALAPHQTQSGGGGLTSTTSENPFTSTESETNSSSIRLSMRQLFPSK
jgi:hypothetical protein